MKIGVIRQENATEVWSTCTMETFLERVKKETKGKYISQLRERLPSLQGSEGRFIHLDKIPRIYPMAEFRQVSLLEHLLMSCFSVASPEEEDGEWLMAMDIFNHLQSKTKEKLALGKLNHLERLLKKWNEPNKRVEKGSLYYLKKTSNVEKTS